MGRATLYSFAGAGIGCLAAILIVGAMTGGTPARDTAAIMLFVGTFLAGSGAIAGAIIGGFAEHFSRTEHAQADGR